MYLVKPLLAITPWDVSVMIVMMLQATATQRQLHRGGRPRGRRAGQTPARAAGRRCVQDDDDDGRL